MNRIQQKLQENKKILSIYFSAGYPNLNDTVQIIQDLEKSGVDMIEIGLPFSDPLADGPTIQASSTQALHNGMTTQMLFDQLKDIRKTVSIPLVIMGYFNPMLQYGIEDFCKKCAENCPSKSIPLDEREEVEGTAASGSEACQRGIRSRRAGRNYGSSRTGIQAGGRT